LLALADGGVLLTLAVASALGGLSINFILTGAIALSIWLPVSHIAALNPSSE
jgi:hypothetical protein